MHSAFQFLKECSFTTRKGINFSTIEALSTRDIFEVVELLVTLTESDNPSQFQTTFSHSASSSLSGRSRCEFLLHRLQRLEHLSRFAVMYSDCVYIDNFFLDYEHFAQRGKSELQRSLIDDISLLLFLKPLLNSGHIKFYTPGLHSCLQCYETALGPDTRKRIHKGHKQLAVDYFNHSSAKLISYNKRFCELEYDGPDPYFEHPIIFTNDVRNRKFHNILATKPAILDRLKRHGDLRLSQALKKEVGLDRMFAGWAASSATFGIILSKMLQTSFLTDNSLDIAFLRSVSDNPQIEYRNSVALKHLTTVVPFIGDVHIRDLVKLRKREEGAFIIFRQALNEALGEFKSAGPLITEKDARALYSDTIAPSLAKLDRKVRTAKRDLVKKAAISVAAVTGAISFGLYSGFLPAEFAQMVKAIGYTQLATNILKQVFAVGQAADTVRSEDFYFLWKAKKLAK